eukprot:IDg17692t1
MPRPCVPGKKAPPRSEESHPWLGAHTRAPGAPWGRGYVAPPGTPRRAKGEPPRSPSADREDERVPAPRTRTVYRAGQRRRYMPRFSTPIVELRA